MTPKQFIQKAIEGGYEPTHWNGMLISLPNFEGGFESWIADNCHKILLDPLSWQAVGKVEGWNDWNYLGFEMSRCEAEMHRMIDALCEGRTIEQFLETL